jgi:PHD/YefM family antitoxin component YafN of YafNO toxin-antitoxin module
VFRKSVPSVNAFYQSADHDVTELFNEENVAQIRRNAPVINIDDNDDFKNTKEELSKMR